MAFKKLKRLIILNPASKNGKGARVFQKLRPQLQERLGNVKVYETTGPRDATSRVRAALKAKEYNQILVAGGDGTVNETVNGYFENGEILDRKVSMGVINLGTGGDFHKTLRQISGLYDVSIKENSYRNVDIGRVIASPGVEAQYFINIASAGLGGQIMTSLKASSFQWGSPAYFYHTLKNLALYHPPKIHIRYLDEAGEWREIDTAVLNFFVCNGRYSGGGMNWAPHGDVEDGVFDVVIIPNIGKAKLVTESSRLYSGRIAEIPGIEFHKAREVIIQSAEKLSGEADGEVYNPQPDQEVKYELLANTFPLII